VKDEDGNDRYIAEGEFFTMGKKLHVYDMQYNEVVFLSQKLMSLLPCYYVYIDDSVAEPQLRFLVRVGM